MVSLLLVLTGCTVSRQMGGLGSIHIPLLSDLNKQISRDYGVLLEGPGIALRWVCRHTSGVVHGMCDGGVLTGALLSHRGLFIIDPNGVVKHMSVNDLPVGRSVEETLRLVKAFQFVETHGEVCPASWTPKSPTVSSSPSAAVTPASLGRPEVGGVFHFK